MVSTLTSVWDQIQTDWEATTPPDRTSIEYVRAVSRTIIDGTAGDRKFSFEGVPPSGIDSESAADTRVRWRSLARLLLSAAGRDVDDFEEAIVNEVNLLSGVMRRRSSWPTGVWFVEPPRWTGKNKKPTGDVELVLTFDAVVGESD